MKYVCLLRHAKSSWDDPALPDHDRPLNDRGRRDAPAVGRCLNEWNLQPDLVLSSTAVRAATTARLVVEAAQLDVPVQFRRELYHAAPDDCLAVLSRLSDEFQRVLVVGHNPGWESLVNQLTGSDYRMPTSALAEIALPIDHWQEIAPGVQGELVRYWSPSESLPMEPNHQIAPGESVRLSDLPTRGKEFHSDRATAEQEFAALREELILWQQKWYAEGKRKLLIVLQAMDAGGKDSTTRRVFQGVNPQGVRVNSFKAPSKDELSRDYLWRVHRRVPAAGMIGIFNRSHYEDVLIVRVDQLVPRSVWEARYEQINQFERLLSDTGTTILKFFLHISKKEQKKRMQARLEDPEKHWKFNRHDLEKRKQWDEYMTAYEDALSRCSTPWAPWYVIPADQKWYRNLAVARVIVDTFRRLAPDFPPCRDEIRGVEID